MANVSPNAIDSIANELQSLINELKSSYQNILNSIQSLNSSITTLQNYNGKDASEILQEIEDIVSLPPKKIVHKYKYKWQIKVSNGNKALSLGNSSLVSNIDEKLSSLSFSQSELVDAATSIANYISIMIETLDNGNMNTVLSGRNFIDYLRSTVKINYSNIKEDNFTPQGYTVIDKNTIMISAYSKNGYNSRLYLYDKDTGTFIGAIVLDGKNHVGGIAYDKDHNVLFVTGSKGEIEAYDYEILKKGLDKEESKYYLLNTKNQNAPKIKCNININKENATIKDRAATITYKDGKLYAATFSGTGKIFEFDVTNSSKTKINVVKTNQYKANGSIQGIAIYKEGNNQYLVTASSAAASPNSYLYKYKLENNSLNYIGNKIIDQQGMEGIHIDSSGNITGIFEYWDSKTESVPIQSIQSSEISSFGEDILNLQGSLYNGQEIASDIKDKTTFITSE